MSPVLTVVLRALPLTALVAYPCAAALVGVQRALFAVLAVGALGAATAGVAWNRPVRPGIWLTLLGAHVLFAEAGVAAAIEGAAGTRGEFPTTADLLRLAAYPALALGLARLPGAGTRPARAGHCSTRPW